MAIKVTVASCVGVFLKYADETGERGDRDDSCFCGCGGLDGCLLDACARTGLRCGLMAWMHLSGLCRFPGKLRWHRKAALMFVDGFYDAYSTEGGIVVVTPVSDIG